MSKGSKRRKRQERQRRAAARAQQVTDEAVAVSLSEAPTAVPAVDAPKPGKTIPRFKRFLAKVLAPLVVPKNFKVVVTVFLLVLAGVAVCANLAVRDDFAKWPIIPWMIGWGAPLLAGALVKSQRLRAVLCCLGGAVLGAGGTWLSGSVPVPALLMIGVIGALGGLFPKLLWDTLDSYSS